MAEYSEKKKLLEEDKESPSSPPPTYVTTQPEKPPLPFSSGEDSNRPNNKILGYLYDHRARIPGYGLLNMVMGSSIYALYVLFALLVAYLLNQLDRYTLPIVTASAGYDLHYGDRSCMQNRSLPEDFLKMMKKNDLTDYFDNCTATDVKHNESLCEMVDFIFPNETIEGEEDLYSICEYNHDGTGLTYQIVAGPVFNNLYPLAGFVMGFLADYGKRIIWLVISLIFWSAVTLLTGFSKAFWHLVLLRALLAIGAAGCSPFAVSILGDYFPAQYRGTAISIYYWGIYIGYSLAFAIGNGIEKVLSWRWVFFLSGIVGLAAGPIILITVREPKRQKSPIASKTDGVKLPFSKRVISLALTFILPGMLVLCLAGGIRNAGGYVWAYNTELFFKDRGFNGDQINHFMSWIPLVAGSIGAVVGGIISDVLVKGRGPYMRIWVLIVSQVLAAPFAAGALFLPYPWCFLTLIPSNVLGEMWIGVTTAIVVDLAPTKIRTASVALYLFIITIIGGNFNLLVSPLRSAFRHSFSELESYQWALFITYPGVYAFSSLLFLLAFFLMRLDLKRKEMFERTMVVNRLPSEDDEDEPDGKAV